MYLCSWKVQSQFKSEKIQQFLFFLITKPLITIDNLETSPLIRKDKTATDWTYSSQTKDDMLAQGWNQLKASGLQIRP